MSDTTPFENRCKARKIRGLCQTGDKPHTLAEAADIQHVSRSTAYRILQDLHTWEAKTTLAEEIADLDKQFRAMPHGKGFYEVGGDFVFLCSGRLALAYMRGELPPELDKWNQHRDDIGDPLMK